MQLSYNNNRFKPQKTSNNLYYIFKQNATKLSILVTSLVVLIFIFPQFVSFPKLFSISSSNVEYPPLHGFYKNDIITKKTLIFPSIEHAPLLRELSINSLFDYIVDQKGIKHYKFTEAIREEEVELNAQLNGQDESQTEMLKIKNSFLNHGKLKFEGNTPDIVLVTGIDFQKYELSHLTKIVQNRVNYAQTKKYGLYVRWLQEFAPFFETYDHEKHKEWVKIYLLRAAMYAFPKAKYFWYLDQDALVMRYDIDVYKYLLDPAVLDPIMLRDQPIIPPSGVIRTFKNSKAEKAELFLTQIGQDLNLNSFIIKNGLHTKSLVEFWGDKLFQNYHNFPNFAESAITHILQWHPAYLARTAIIPPRTIASLTSVIEVDDDIHYKNGDFIVSLRGCDETNSCTKEIDRYWAIVEKKD
ncbi:hypothetical protein WICPIJ_005049 [Wickerhamomyces pijperi]|uniref:Glycosyltransferase family 34 protein n=1 Tax=Wickerhamomyces pijperi TaxID=599730 RepID=A0A9P8TMB0_WICPI|nr:hypothetical protein WICPIJ_005049 [Wickerhamomyces pijperi]